MSFLLNYMSSPRNSMFSFFNGLQWFLNVMGSAAVTLLLIFTFEMVKTK